MKQKFKFVNSDDLAIINEVESICNNGGSVIQIFQDPIKEKVGVLYTEKDKTAPPAEDILRNGTEKKMGIPPLPYEDDEPEWKNTLKQYWFVVVIVALSILYYFWLR